MDSKLQGGEQSKGALPGADRHGGPNGTTSGGNGEGGERAEGGQAVAWLGGAILGWQRTPGHVSSFKEVNSMVQPVWEIDAYAKLLRLAMLARQFGMRQAAKAATDAARRFECSATLDWTTAD